MFIRLKSVSLEDAKSKSADIKKRRRRIPPILPTEIACKGKTIPASAGPKQAMISHNHPEVFGPSRSYSHQPVRLT